MIEALGKIKDAIFGIYDFFCILFDFAIGLIGDLLKIVDLLGEVVADMPFWLNAFLPPGVPGLFMLLISITVIYRIAGRD